MCIRNLFLLHRQLPFPQMFPSGRVVGIPSAFVHCGQHRRKRVLVVKCGTPCGAFAFILNHGRSIGRIHGAASLKATVWRRRNRTTCNSIILFCPQVKTREVTYGTTTLEKTLGSGARRAAPQASRSIPLWDYAYRTEQAYVDWITRYILYHGKRHPQDMGSAEVQAFLTHLAVEKNVAASTHLRSGL